MPGNRITQAQRRTFLALIPQSKEAAKTVTEIWRLSPKDFDRTLVSSELASLSKSGVIKRFKVDGPKGNQMWKYWLDPMHG